MPTFSRFSQIAPNDILNTGQFDFVEAQTYIEGKWHKKWGDHLNELIFIGYDLEKGQLQGELEACLLQDPKYPLFEQQLLEDPFPKEI